MTFSNISISLIFMSFGLYLLFFTPPRGYGIGYRTKHARKSNASWIYANRLSGILLTIIIPTVVLLITILSVMFPWESYLLSKIYFVMNILTCIIVSIIVEIKLKLKFGDADK